jgi:hypothetical protein
VSGFGKRSLKMFVWEGRWTVVDGRFKMVDVASSSWWIVGGLVDGDGGPLV